MSPETERQWWRQPYRLVLIGFLAVAAYFLITEHRAHLNQILLVVLLLACPVMHLFMHHGHGGHGGPHGGRRHRGDRDA